MTSTDTVGLVVVLSILGAIFVVGGALSIAGKLPLNPLVGIRIPSTMMSDAAWKAAHKAAGPYLILCGLCALGGVVLVLTAPSLGVLPLVLIPAAALVIFLIIAVIVASRNATRASIG